MVVLQSSSLLLRNAALPYETAFEQMKSETKADCDAGNSPKNVIWIIYYGLLLCSPVLFSGFPYPTHDGEIQETWYSHFASQLSSGDTYPRWLQGMNGGLGSPTFFFYPSLPFFITSAFRPFFADSLTSWRILGVSAALALVLSGVFAYLWFRKIANNRSATFGAILYMAMPYHFTVDLFTRGAFAEFWAFVWMPLIVYFAHKTIQYNRPVSVGLAISYGLLILTHLPTTLMFSVVPLAYVLWIAPVGGKSKCFVHVGISMALGVALASIYLLPALLEQDSVSLEIMREGHGYYEHGFFLPHTNWADLKVARDDFEHSLFWIVMTVVGVGLSASFLARNSPDAFIRRQTRFWLVIAALAVFMMFPLSKPIYQLFPSLQMIQFPWRFNTVLTLAVSVLVAVGFASIRKPYSDSVIIALVIGGALLLHWIPITARPLLETSLGNNPYLSGSPSPRKKLGHDTLEYRTRWAMGDYEQLLLRLRDYQGNLTKARIVDGDGNVTVQVWKPRHIVMLVDAKIESILEVSQFYYPTWTAMLDNKSLMAVQFSKPDGLVILSVPPGRHSLELRFAKTRYEALGMKVSFGTIIMLLCIQLFVSGRNWVRRFRIFGTSAGYLRKQT